jgi:hypothetical protein
MFQAGLNRIAKAVAISQPMHWTAPIQRHRDDGDWLYPAARRHANGRGTRLVVLADQVGKEAGRSAYHQLPRERQPALEHSALRRQQDVTVPQGGTSLRGKTKRRPKISEERTIDKTPMRRY